jgi:hypothetical protein
MGTIARGNDQLRAKEPPASGTRSGLIQHTMA